MRKDEDGPLITPWVTPGRPMQMGLRSCFESDWLFADDAFHKRGDTLRQMTLKSNLCQSRHSEIFIARPEALEASNELFEIASHNLNHYHDRQVSQQPSLHPLERIGRAVPEDILLLAPIRDKHRYRWTLKAGLLAFPAHWSLAEKMDKPLTAIHAPVHHLEDELSPYIDRFFTNMVPHLISKRYNWTLQIDDLLFAPHRSEDITLNQDEVETRLFVRVERQTLRKLPDSGWIVFTIRTSLAPLSLWRDEIEALQALQEQIDGFSDEMRDYRNVKSYEASLRHWIAARAKAHDDEGR